MGISKNCATFLFYSKSQGVSFDKTLTLGRLNLYVSRDDIEQQIKKFKTNSKKQDEVVFKDEYSEPLFEILGASLCDSMDFSDYERANIVHDLNQPVPETLKGKYSAIVDGGTIEHVFNFPTAIKNCMEMLQTGGHYMGITPVNNLMGHGFYQFSPELYYSVFSADNGFEIKKMIVVTQDGSGKFSSWYEVLDPHKTKCRVVLTNFNPTFLLILAEKKSERPVFEKPPQQSDYEMVWNINDSLHQNKAPKNEGFLKYLYRKYTPKRLKIFVHNVYDLFTKQEVVNEELGKINPEHFRKMEI